MINLVHQALRYASSKAKLGLPLLIFLPCLAYADVLKFTDRAAWAAAAGSLTNIPFDAAPQPPDGPAGEVFDTAAGVTISGVRFAGPSSFSPTGFEVLVFGDVDFLPHSLWGGEVEIDITLPQGTRAVGSDIGVTIDLVCPDCRPSFYSINLSTGDTFTDIPSDGPSFLGFISTSPITSLKLVSNNTFPFLQNFAISAVPEPKVWTLIALSLFGLPLLLRSSSRFA